VASAAPDASPAFSVAWLTVAWLVSAGVVAAELAVTSTFFSSPELDMFAGHQKAILSKK
jgi:hypothetical protein